MTSYLLLRNNKESGPFLKDQLIQFGLKPYDLIWIEGKSAAWCYPSEIPELKEYAPTIEEQPFDRFFKKNNEEQKVNEPIVSEVKSTYENPETIKGKKYVQNRNVSIIMPDKPTFQKTESSVSRIIIKEEHPQVETKFSQQLDEIKEMYVRQLQQRKHKTAGKKLIIKRSKQVAIILAIIGTGFFSGILLKSKSHSQKSDPDLPIKNTPTINQAVITNNTNIDSLKTNETTGQFTVDNKQTASNEILMVPAKEKVSEKNPITEKKEEQMSSTEVQQNNITAGDLDINKKNSGKQDDSETEEILKSVSLKSNNYKLKAFGGFQNLELTVQNDSKYALDNVLVELQYLKINDKPAKIEHIKFQSIAPGGSLTIKIPDNNRGAKLAYKIIKVESKAITPSTAGL